MPVSNSQAQGLVLALFGASAGGHLTSLAAASNLNTLAGDLSMSAGLILGRDLSSNTAFRDHVTGNLKLTGDARTAANAWLDGQLNAGAARGDIIATAVTFLSTLTDTTSPFFASAQAFQSTVAAAVTWSTGAGATTFGVSALRAQQGNVDVVPGSSFVLTTATAGDTIIGTAGDDVVTGVLASSGSTITTGDRIVDGSSTDNDTANLTLNAGLGSDPTLTGIENVNLTIASATAVNSTAANMSGVKNLTVTMTNPVVGGVTLNGNKVVDVRDVDASKVAKVTAGAGTTNLNVVQVTKSGVTVDGDTATGAVTVTGTGTVNVAAAVGAVTVTPIDTARSTTFVENTKPITVNAAAAAGNVLIEASAGSRKFAGPITVNAATTKSVVINNDADATTAINAVNAPVTVNAAKAETVTVDDATWGATVNAATANAASATVTVNGITSNGATITVGSGTASTATNAKTMTVNIGGTGSATTEKATVSAAGVVALDIGAAGSTVNAVTLAGNGADVTYTITDTSGNGLTSLAATGDYKVNVKANDAIVNGKTVTGVDTLSLTAHTSASTSVDSVDLTKVSAKTIALEADLRVSADSNNDTLALANGANLLLTANQTTALVVTTANAGDAITLTVGDTNGTANTALPTFTTGTLDVSGLTATATARASVTLDATTGKATLSSGIAGAANVNMSVRGTRDVDLGTVDVLRSLDASALTGKLTVTASHGSSTSVPTITAGTGGSAITLNDTNAFTVTGGAGIDTVTLTSMGANSVITTGAGNDVIENLGGSNSKASSVIVTGEGDDEVKLVGAADAVVNMGDGSADQLTVTDDANLAAYSSGAYTTPNAAVTGVEKVDIANTKTLTLSAAQFAQDNTFALSNTGTLAVVGNLTGASNGTGVASTIDASGVTRASGVTAAVTLTGSSKADVITGSAGADTIRATAGADSIDAGTGTDTFDTSNLGDLGGSSVTLEGASAGAQKGVVINLGSTAVANTAILAATGLYTADTVTSVAANTVAYQYAAAGSTNSAVTQAVAGFEAVIGTSGKDYIVASSAGTTITGGAGADHIVAGAGSDVIAFTATSQAGDTVAGFSAAADQLQFTAANFGSTATWSSGALITATTATATYFEVTTDAAASAVDLNASGTTTTGFVVFGVATGTGGVKVYYTTDVGAFATGNSTLIATLTGIALDAISAADFQAV